jgi:hypothetical protein
MATIRFLRRWCATGALVWFLLGWSDSAPAGALYAYVQGASAEGDFGPVAIGADESFASADYGILKATSKARWGGSGRAASGAEFVDSFLIEAAPGAPPIGAFDFSVTPSFSLTAFSTAQNIGASAGVTLALLVGTDIYDFRSAYRDTLSYNSSMNSGTPLTYTSTYSGSVGVFAQVTALAIVELYGGEIPHNPIAHATADFGNTLTWGGITNVRDVNGNLVEDFRVISESGFDYRYPYPEANPVPEPASLTLLASGALCAAGLGWRRRKQAA